MTISSEITWTANGLNLNTYAWAVRTAGGRRYIPATKRGEDQVIPFANGRRHMPKTRESMLLTLPMWVLPLNQDGTTDGSRTYEEKIHDNWNLLLSKLDTDGQFDLVKRWYVGGEVRQATARAELVGGMIPEVEGAYKWNFDVELLLADPYFYGPWTASDVLPNDPAIGDVPTSHVVISQANTTVGARVTFPDGNWLQIDRAVGSVVYDLDACTAYSVGEGYVNGYVHHNPAHQSWPKLKPGGVITTSGATTAAVSYQPAYR